MDLILTIFSFLANIIVSLTHPLIQSPHYWVTGSLERLSTGGKGGAGVRPAKRISVVSGYPSVTVNKTHIRLMYLYITVAFTYIHIGGIRGSRDAPLPLLVQFFSFSCSFWEKLVK